MPKSDTNSIKRIFDLYTSDLSVDEIERLIKKESADVYKYFAKDTVKQDKNRNKFFRALIFLRNLFNAFVLRLTPARRILYLAAIFIFFIGYIQNFDGYLLFSFLMINLLLAFELADKLTAKDEITLARKIQDSLIPQKPPANNNYDISCFYESANDVSGDYFDFIPEKDNKLIFVIGDISGKGLPAALYMVRAQAIIHSLLNHFDDLRNVVNNLKTYFCENLQPGFFLTLSAAKIDQKGELKFFRAGHTPALLYKYAENKFYDISPKGMGIGLKDNGMFSDILEEKTLHTSSGDIVMFYTDGITDTQNPDMQQFGMAPVKEIIRAHSEKSSEEIKDKLMEKLNNFRKTKDGNDDITFVIFKRKEKQVISEAASSK